MNLYNSRASVFISQNVSKNHHRKISGYFFKSRGNIGILKSWGRGILMVLPMTQAKFQNFSNDIFPSASSHSNISRPILLPQNFRTIEFYRIYLSGHGCSHTVMTPTSILMPYITAGQHSCAKCLTNRIQAVISQ
jgi:hypothetical protein